YRVESGDDLFLHVREDANLAQIDPYVCQILGDVADVLVLGATGQDLVADHQKRGRYDVLCRFRLRLHERNPRTCCLARLTPHTARLKPEDGGWGRDLRPCPAHVECKWEFTPC